MRSLGKEAKDRREDQDGAEAVKLAQKQHSVIPGAKARSGNALLIREASCVDVVSW